MNRLLRQIVMCGLSCITARAASAQQAPHYTAADVRFMQGMIGHHAQALVMTALILFVTASSLYGVILGYSRIPFAAAREGQFFRVFARVHPTKHFPQNT